MYLAAPFRPTTSLLAFVDPYLELTQLRPGLHLETDVRVIAGGWWPSNFEALLVEHQPPLVLLDLDLPAPVAAQPYHLWLPLLWCARCQPQTRLIALADQLETKLLEAWTGQPLFGYILRADLSPLTLTAALRTVLSGGIYLSPSAQPTWPKPEAPLATLTARQMGVLRQVLTQPDAHYAFHAAQLGIRTGTLKKHLQQIFQRLGVGNLAAAALMAAQAGWLAKTD